MALDVTRLTIAIKGAFVDGGADSTSPLLAAMSAALANAIVNEFTQHADVLPTGTPPMSNGAGAVAGVGKIA